MINHDHDQNIDEDHEHDPNQDRGLDRNCDHDKDHDHDHDHDPLIRFATKVMVITLLHYMIICLSMMFTDQLCKMCYLVYSFFSMIHHDHDYDHDQDQDFDHVNDKKWI